ncbi:MAG: hypothetical protein LUG84_08765 [Akkermansiaceae bacterium]|nr:hypothetical protein [Akkermansiaceae bacterium]
MILHLLLLMACSMLCIAGWLRHTKGVAPVQRAHRWRSSSFPAPAGLVYRLDGAETPNRTVSAALTPRVTANGGVAFPRGWNHCVTLGTVSIVAYTWALAKLAEDNPDGHREREQALDRALIVPTLAFAALAIFMALGRINPFYALTLTALVWAVMAYSAFRTHGWEWQAVTIAREGLKTAGMWPQMPGASHMLDRALSAQAWCRIGGFPRYFPRWCSPDPMEQK